MLRLLKEIKVALILAFIFAAVFAIKPIDKMIGNHEPPSVSRVHDTVVVKPVIISNPPQIIQVPPISHDSILLDSMAKSMTAKYKIDSLALRQSDSIRLSQIAINSQVQTQSGSTVSVGNMPQTVSTTNSNSLSSLPPTETSNTSSQNYNGNSSPNYTQSSSLGTNQVSSSGYANNRSSQNYSSTPTQGNYRSSNQQYYRPNSTGYSNQNASYYRPVQQNYRPNQNSNGYRQNSSYSRPVQQGGNYRHNK